MWMQHTTELPIVRVRGAQIRLHKCQSRNGQARNVHDRDQTAPVAGDEPGIDDPVPREDAIHDIAYDPRGKPVDAVGEQMPSRCVLAGVNLARQPHEKHGLERDPGDDGDDALESRLRAVGDADVPESLLHDRREKVGIRPAECRERDVRRNGGQRSHNHRCRGEQGAEPGPAAALAAPNLAVV